MSRLITRAVCAKWILRRSKNAHKGTSGRVLILAGSRGMAGAGILCAEGAIHAGAGLVRLGIVKSQQKVAATRMPVEATSVALPEDSNGHLSPSALPAIRKLIATFKPDVIALGPGFGVTPAVKKIVFHLVYHGAVPVVLDADGLNAVVGQRRKFQSLVVMTPHAGELARLIGAKTSQVNAKREASAIQAAKKFGAVCLLKGPGTIVTDGRDVWKNSTGNPAMSTGGMGDVLTGIIAALWAERIASKAGDEGIIAAALGAYVHGAAGDMAAKKISHRSLLASQVAGCVQAAIKKI